MGFGAFPVLPPLACDETGRASERRWRSHGAAAAASLEADVLAILSNIPITSRSKRQFTLIKMAALEDWANLEGYSQGNMKRKLLAAKEALEGGLIGIYRR